MLLRTRIAPPRGLSSAHPRSGSDPDMVSASGALRLLSEILARLPGVVAPIIQIVPASASGGAQQVARSLAVAAAERHGRVLLLSSNSAHDYHGFVPGLSWLMSELRVDAESAIVPDAAVPGLYHSTTSPNNREAPKLATWLSKPPGFSMIIVESAALAIDPKTILTTRQCDGVILAVAAGISRLDEVSAAARQFNCADVRLLGTVLYDAPYQNNKLL